MEESSESFVPALYKPPALLPIARHKEALQYHVETFPVTILVGETGSGKTTQLPQYLLEGGWCNDGKIIGITQPRRIAAVTVASRVASELRCQVGQDVGYSIRFEDMTSASTRIKFLTDGLLLREALVDPLLNRYSVVIVDEAHERSLSTDILLGILKKIGKRRPDLRIVISSATLQAESFMRFFSHDDSVSIKDDGSLHATDCGIVSIEGRTFPVDIHYSLAPVEDYLNSAIDLAITIHDTENAGDILIFLTGRDEIEKAMERLTEQSAALSNSGNGDKLLPLPLYAGLTVEQQMYVFEPAPEKTRKVICATNIAEASVTVNGVVYVIDCGFVKLRAYDPTTGIETLVSTPTSKASAAQRAGRAGRERPGKCYRLYTERAFAQLEDETVPEIRRSNLAPMILQLKALGIDNVARFDYLSPPPSQLMTRALELLFSLSALDEYAKLTKPLGARMAEIAIEPMLAKCLLAAPSFDCLSEMLSISAMVSLQGNIWFTHDNKKQEETARRKFAVEEGDHLTLLNIYQAFVSKGQKDAKWCHQHYLNSKSMSRAVSIRNQVKRYLERFGVDVSESLRNQAGVLRAGSSSLETSRPIGERIRRCLTSGYFAHAARMQADGTFRTVSGAVVLHAHPSSLMFNRTADWVIFTEAIETSSKTFIREVTKIERDWLTEYAPQFYKIHSGTNSRNE